MALMQQVFSVALKPYAHNNIYWGTHAIVGAAAYFMVPKHLTRNLMKLRNVGLQDLTRDSCSVFENVAYSGILYYALSFYFGEIENWREFRYYMAKTPISIIGKWIGIKAAVVYTKEYDLEVTGKFIAIVVGGFIGSTCSEYLFNLFVKGIIICSLWVRGYHEK